MMKLATRQQMGTLTAATLLGIGGLHGAWGLGVYWPGQDSLSLANRVVGGSKFPSSFDCFVVASLLGGAAGLVVANTYPSSVLGRAVPSRIRGLGVGVVASVLGARGALGMISSVVNLPATTQEFRRLNLSLYSPLCMALGLGALAARSAAREQ
jgi:hypothetical protein